MNDNFTAKDEITFCAHSPEETMALGEKLGRSFRGCEVVALIGPLGSGKTCFVQGIVKGLNLRADQRVKSPTYVIINNYQGRVPIYHIDLYRLGGVEELEELGLEELIGEGGVTVIEWAEKAMELLPESCTRVNFQIICETERLIRVVGPTVRFLHHIT